MPGSMPTIRHLRSVHSRADGLLLRMDVPLRDIHVAVPGKVCQRPGIHVGCPSGQARVPQGVKLETLERCIFLPGLLAKYRRCLLDRLTVLLLDCGRLDVPAFRWSGKNPLTAGSL